MEIRLAKTVELKVRVFTKVSLFFYLDNHHGSTCSTQTGSQQTVFSILV